MTGYKFEIKWDKIPKFFILETFIPTNIVDDINIHLDNLINDEKKVDNSHKLVGQIRNGYQLALDHEDLNYKEFSGLIKALCNQYLVRYSQELSDKIWENSKITFDQIWSVHSYTGDYNPIHDHGTRSVTGLSFICWTKIPDSIQSSPELGDLKNASGNADGYLNFIFGDGGSRLSYELKPPQLKSVKPVIGKVLIFPSWLLHSVNPFESDGERRTISGNLSVWREDYNIST